MFLSYNAFLLSKRRFTAALLLICGVQFVAFGAVASPAEPDRWEGFNRRIFSFNETVDQLLVLPLAHGYQAITPEVVDRGVSNMLSNLGELLAVLNDLLQLRLGMAANDTGRFLINSTLGVFGVFDVAGKFGLQKNRQDFGITLARWGVQSGPYMVLPMLGPSTLRDTFGWAPDIWLHPLQLIEDDIYRNVAVGLRFVDARADAIEVDQLITGDRYVFLRDVWRQKRQFEITGEAVVDDFGDEDF